MFGEAITPKPQAAPLPSFPSAGIAIAMIRRIDPLSTRNPRVTEYVVTAETLAHPPALVVYSTINRSLSDLCAWCLDSEWPAQISWKRTRYGLQITDVAKAVRR